MLIIKDISNTIIIFSITKCKKHTIAHTFGNVTGRQYKDRINVLIHINWLLQKEDVEVTDQEQN